MEEIGDSPGTEQSRTASTYRKLRSLIIQGRLSPGQQLVETDLAQRFGVSRTPVRSAIQRLQQEGFLVAADTGARSRAVVAPLTQEDAREVFYLIGALEGLMARSCAALGDEERQSVVTELQRINDELEELVVERRPDRNVWSRLDAEFHGTYVDAAAGPRLKRYHTSIRPQAERYLRIYYAAHAHEIRTSVEEHRPIIAALETGELEWVEEAVETNWRNSAERLLRGMEEMGELGGW